MWTVQEVTLANGASDNNVILLCGKETFTWATLFVAVDRLKASGYNDDYGDAIKLQNHILTMVMGKRVPSIKAVLDSKADSAKNVRGGDVIACQILWLTRRKAATDPKDKVYALHGLFRELEIAIPDPDYKKTVQEIYCEAAAACLRHDKEKKFLLLTMAPTLNRMPGLPSWVPDWSDKGWNHDSGLAIANDRVHATDSSEFSMEISADNQRLTMPGKIIDSIVTCGETLSEDILEAFKDISRSPPRNLAVDDRYRSVHRVFQTFKNWVEINRRNSSYPTGEPIESVLRKTLLQNSINTDDLIIDTWYKIMTASDTEVLKIALQRLGKSQIDDPETLNTILERVPEEMRSFFAIFSEGSSDFHTNAYSFSRDRTFFLTEKGFVGTAPGLIQTGDTIALFSGVKVPLILRADGDNYQLVAHGYVHGVTQGLAWDSGNGLSNITLV